jgi:hypothetical protein
MNKISNSINKMSIMKSTIYWILSIRHCFKWTKKLMPMKRKYKNWRALGISIWIKNTKKRLFRIWQAWKQRAVIWMRRKEQWVESQLFISKRLLQALIVLIALNRGKPSALFFNSQDQTTQNYKLNSPICENKFNNTVRKS